MTITTFKDLEKLIKLCKKQGIKAIKVDNIEFAVDSTSAINPHTGSNFEDVFPEAKIKVPKFNGLEPDKIDTDELTEEQKLFYSAKEEPGSEQ